MSEDSDILPDDIGHLATDENKWTAPRHIPRLQGFDATVPHFYEAPTEDPSHLEVWSYTDRISYQPGDRVQIHTSTTGPGYSLEIHRDGASRDVVHRATDLTGSHHQTPKDFYENGCGWPVAHEWTIPDDLDSGFYLLISRTEGEGGTTREHEHGFCVRPKRARSKVLFLLSTSTWIAYSDWGGTNNYLGLASDSGDGFAARLSIHKPWAKGFMYVPEGAPRKPHEINEPMGAIPRYPPIEFAYTRGYSKFYASSGWATFERNFAVWAEESGIPLDYATQCDLHAQPEILDDYDCVAIAGHDEYWSKEMRDAMDAYLEAGGHLARFAGNFSWQIRLEDEGQTQVCYKQDAMKRDPLRAEGPAGRLTSIWDLPGGRPGPHTVGVCGISGIYARVGHQSPRHAGGFTVYRHRHWALAGTNLRYGDQLGDDANIFGYEVDGLDVEIRNGLPYPTGRDGALPGTEVIALGLAGLDELDPDVKGSVRFYGEVSPLALPVKFGFDPTDEQRAGAAYGNGVIVTAPKGKGEIFCAGSCEWVNGLKRRDPFVERITKNVLQRYAALENG